MNFGMSRRTLKVDGQPLRAALVGTGYIAHFHAQALSQAEGVRLVSVCDSNLSSAESFGAAWRVPAYNSLEAMLQAQEIDAVHVLVPPITIIRWRR
jgi:predicted dehydrogenase